MTEKSDMVDLFEEFESLPEVEDTVRLDEVVVPEDDFFEAPEIDEPVYPTYGGVQEPTWPSHTFKTGGGKTIEVYHEKMGTLWGIKFREGGQLPNELRSKFTSDIDAVKAVEVYLARQ